MRLLSLALENFRNYRSQRFEFNAAGNLIVGANGSGKTNLLEAIAYCGIGKSIRFHSDSELLHFDSCSFSLNARFLQDTGLERNIVILHESGRKLLRIDAQPIRNLSSLMESIKIIYCAPEDLNIIAGSPRSRRQYFDLAIGQLFPEYLTLLHEYLHILEQRNQLLKSQIRPPDKRSWDDRFANSIIQVLSYRAKYLRLLNESLSGKYAFVSDRISGINLSYHQSIRDLSFDQLDTDIIRDHLRVLESREMLLQRSLFGPHLDDYEFWLGDVSQKTYSSQGQKRISVNIVKLIQAKLIEEVTGIRPVMLFDDIFAELDHEHTQIIRDLIGSDYQVYITTPKPELTDIWSELQPIRLEDKNEAE